MASGTVKKLSNVSFYTKKFSATYSLDAASISSSSITPKSATVSFDVTQTGWTPLGVISFETGGGIHPCATVDLTGSEVEMVVTNFKNQAYSNRTAYVTVLYYQDA